MSLAYKYVKRKRNERQAAPSQHNESGSSARPATTDCVAAADAQPSDPAEGNAATEKTDPSPEEVAEKKRRRKYRWKIVIGLFAPFALQALDTTIIASAMPYIATDFNEIQQINWIISSFNLTSAAFLFFWAQLADIFGRHVTIHAAIFVVMIGSAICTGAPTSAYSVLLLGRSLQGIGVAGVNIAVRTILADRVSLSDYAINWTLFIVISGVSFSIGPVVGGYLTESSWRWCFAINLPVAVLAIVLVIIVLRKELLGPQPLPELGEHDTSTRHGRLLARLSTIDYGGQLLFLWGLGLLSLGLTWGGGTYSWTSAAVLAPLVIGSVLSVAWVFYEYSMTPGLLMARIFPQQRAMIPWNLLSQRDIGLLFVINFTVGMGMFAVMYFMDLYFALVEKKSSSSAGIALLFYLPGLGVGGYMAMFSSNVWPRQTLPALMFGGITAAVGITVLPWAIQTENTNVIYGMMALVGHGVTMRLNPSSLHGLAYFPTMTAPITCLLSFAMPFGGLVGLTIMSTVFTNKVKGPQGAKDGIMSAFIAMVPFMWLCVLLTMFLGNVWILKDGTHEVVNGVYLWSFVTRKTLTRERKTRGDLANTALVAGEKDSNVEAGTTVHAKDATGNGPNHGGQLSETQP